MKIETHIGGHLLIWGPSCSKERGIRPNKNFWAVKDDIEMNGARMAYATGQDIQIPDHQDWRRKKWRWWGYRINNGGETQLILIVEESPKVNEHSF